MSTVADFVDPLSLLMLSPLPATAFPLAAVSESSNPVIQRECRDISHGGELRDIHTQNVVRGIQKRDAFGHQVGDPQVSVQPKWRWRASRTVESVDTLAVFGKLGERQRFQHARHCRPTSRCRCLSR